MPVKRTGEKQKPPPSPRDLPRKGPLTATQMFTPPEFAREDVNKVWQAPYRCSCCNRLYDTQQGNFYKTKSDLYSAANGYLTICKKCGDAYYEHSVVKLRSEHQALLHIAQMFDWYVSDQMIDEVLANPNTKKPLGELAKRLNRTNAPEGTYLDALIDGVVAIAPEQSDGDESTETEDAVNPRAVELFGPGFTAQEYELMVQHYDKLLKQFENADGLQESIILALCQIHTAGQIAYIRKDMEGFEKMQRLYNQTVKDDRLKAKKNDANADDDSATWGTILAMVEQYAPADAYQQDDFYRDVDGVDQYMRQTYLRSVANYFGKTDERDPDFSLTDEEILGDG